MTQKRTRTRLLRLEQAFAANPVTCPQCGHTTTLRTRTAIGNATDNAANAHDSDFDATRLTTAERHELATLFHACSTPPCARCGQPANDITLLTDAQKERMLELLRQLDCESDHATGRLTPSDFQANIE